ncbi:MAG: hypothetical protein GX640_07980 [Fibrobacter sp.]|nr:hypothetical protein [Fibrobacter sp.]
MQSRRIVITDVGIISALGMGFSKVNEALAMPPVKTTVKDFEFHQFENEIPCYGIRDFDPVAVLGKKGLRTKDNSTKLLLGTFESELKASMETPDDQNRPGICIGTAFGSVQSIGDFLSDSIVNGVGNVNPQAFANTVINSPTGNANIRFIARNLSATVSTGFNSGIDAIIYAFDHISRGYLNSIVAGGLEEISYYSLLGLARTGILSKSGNCRPFATDSDGIVMGEGCALFLLETIESAQARNATVLAEIVGVCSTFDPNAAFGDSIDSEAAAAAIKGAIEQAKISIDDIDFIASGASGNRRSDSIEASAIKSIFGTKTPVTAYKALTGECYGASGAIVTMCALSDMKNGKISGIGNTYSTINEIPVVFDTIKKDISYALVTSVSCDGNCSALVIKNIK